MKNHSCIFAAIGAALLLGSCSSTGFLGLARASYVEEELEKMEGTASDVARIEEKMSELDTLNARLTVLDEAVEAAENADEQLRGRVGGIEEAGAVMQSEIGELEEENAGLKTLAEDFRRQLENMPETTLRELMDAIASHLDGTAAAQDDYSTGSVPADS